MNPTQTNETLMSLAARVEEAPGADRELDALIEKALPPRDPRSTLPSLWNERAARYHSAGIGDWDDQSDYVPTRYTASLDAAMTLVPEGCAIDFRRFTDGKARAAVWRTLTHPEPAFEHHCERAATAALAVLAAALKARAHSGERE